MGTRESDDVRHEPDDADEPETGEEESHEGKNSAPYDIAQEQRRTGKSPNTKARRETGFRGDHVTGRGRSPSSLATTGT